MSHPPSSALTIPLSSPSPRSSPFSTASRESRNSYEEPPEWNVQHEPTQNFSQSDYLNAVEPPIVPTPRPVSTASHHSSLTLSHPGSRHSTIRLLPFPPSTITVEPPSDEVRPVECDFLPIVPSLSSPHPPSSDRSPSPQIDIDIVPSIPPVDPRPSSENEEIPTMGEPIVSTAPTAGANSAPPPPPIQAWTIPQPPTGLQGIFQRIIDRVINSPIMCSCLNRVKCAHAWVKNTFGIPDEPPFYNPEPERISPRDPPANETEEEKKARLTREARHMENLNKLRVELNGFTSNTIIYHNTPDGDEQVTYYRPRPKDVPTPGSELLENEVDPIQ